MSKFFNESMGQIQKSTNRIFEKKKFFLIILVLAIPCVCYADAGIPMLMVAYPFMIMALIPIILIESYFMKKKLIEINFSKAIKVCTVSNLISTILGIPLTWLILLAVDLLITNGKTYFTGTFIDNVINVTLGAPWVPEGWYSFAALMFLLIPFFFVSFFIENKVSQKMLIKIYERRGIKQAVLWGNFYSYLFLEVVVIALWILRKH